MSPILLLLLLAFDRPLEQELVRIQGLSSNQAKILALRELAGKADRASELEARIRLELASSLLIAGDYEAGEVEARTAETNFSAPKDKARALNVEGTSWLYRADYRKSLDFYNKALPLADTAARITILNNAGNAHYYLGDYGEAWRQYAEAAKLLEQVTGPSRQEDEFTTRVNQATILQRLGKDREAMQSYRTLGSLASKDDYVGKGQLLANLGAVYRRLGDPYKALEAYNQALDNFERGQYADGKSGVWINIGIANLVDMRDYAASRRAFGKAISSSNGREKLQARMYLAETDRRDGRMKEAHAGFLQALDDARRLQSVEDIWKALFGLGRSAASAGEARKYYLESLKQIESIRLNVQRGSQRRDFLSDKREVYDAYLDLLTNPAELLEWMEKSRARMLQEEIPQRSLQQIQDLLQPAETLLVTSSLPRGFLLLFIRRDVVKTVRIDEIAQLPAAIESNLTAKLLVVPDRQLAGISFDSLRLPRSGRYIVQQSEVSYLPAASLLRNRAAPPLIRYPWQKSVLAVAVAKTKAGVDRDLPELPEVVREAQIVAASVTGRASQSVNPAKGALLEALPKFPLLHFASHAVVDPQDASRSRLVLESDSLYLRDLEGIDLSGLQLVTLSACQTASGAEIVGEGIDSLANGFLRAGARTVVASLTPVNDEASVEFVRGLYHGLGQGLSPAEALRNSKLRFLRSGGALADPRHWAPYLVYGNAGEPVSKPVWWIGWAGLIVAATGIAAAMFLRTTAKRS